MTSRLCRAAILLVTLMLITSCSDQKTVAVDDAAMLNELGNEFFQELNDHFIFARESTKELEELDAVLVTEDKTYQIDLLYDFYEAYEAGNSGRLITVFKTKSFVVTKIVFQKDACYFFRYEFDPLNEKDITITSEIIENVDVQHDSKLKKVTLTLARQKKTPIVFTYRNIAEND